MAVAGCSICILSISLAGGCDKDGACKRNRQTYSAATENESGAKFSSSIPEKEKPEFRDQGLKTITEHTSKELQK